MLHKLPTPVSVVMHQIVQTNVGPVGLVGASACNKH